MLLLRHHARRTAGVGASYSNSRSLLASTVGVTRLGQRCRIQLLAASSRCLTSSSASASTATSEPTLDGQRPIASQVNGAQHGSTIYTLDAALPNAFRTHKTHEFAVKLWSDTNTSSDTTSTNETSNNAAQPALSPAAQAKALLQRSTERSVEFLWDLFLPKDAHTSVTRDYFPYAKWYFVASIASSAAGVLSMQSLLYAIGLGAGSIPTAAAVNWVLKDGLGQFGGVMFASLVNNRYDADPKRWRTASSVALDAAILVEILTPLAPAYFLPMASLANVAKNISWLSASATRAGFHNSFAQRENLADVTAKAGSQAIASSIIGTGLGIALSTLTGASTPHVLAAFSVLSVVHIATIYQSLASVSLRTLNCQRLHLVARAFLASTTTAADGSALDKSAGQIPTIDAVSHEEQFMPLLLTGYRSLYRNSIVHSAASLESLCHNSPRELLRLKTFYAHEKYLLSITRPQQQAATATTPVQIHLALADDATSHDALRAHLHAAIVQRTLEREGNAADAHDADAHDAWRTVERAYDDSCVVRDSFVAQLEASEWHTENLLVEEQNSRFKWIT